VRWAYLCPPFKGLDDPYPMAENDSDLGGRKNYIGPSTVIDVSRTEFNEFLAQIGNDGWEMFALYPETVVGKGIRIVAWLKQPIATVVPPKPPRPIAASQPTSGHNRSGFARHRWGADPAPRVPPASSNLESSYPPEAEHRKRVLNSVD
jgi:hypothetical protein